MHLSESEMKFFEKPVYRRNGVIPGWAEVVSQFNLADELNPADFRLARAFYRFRRRLAEGSTKRANRLMAHLERHQNFRAFEERYGNLLTQISSFVTKPERKTRI